MFSSSTLHVFMRTCRQPNPPFFLQPRWNHSATNKMSKKQGKEENIKRPKSARMSVLFSNPDYLLEGYAEKKCLYIGEIKDMPTNADTSDRGYLLTQLDNKRNAGSLPWTLGQESAVSLTISAYNLKIIADDKNGAVLRRIPIHEVASASYVNDDNTHLVFIMAGNATQACCPCHIFNCSKRADAEEICTILQQAFQLVYTEATIEHFNNSITAGEKGLRSSRNSLMLIPKPQDLEQKELQSSPVRSTPRVPPLMTQTLIEEDTNDGQGDVSAVEIVQNYMERLHDLLDFKELREFANLLKHYREDLKVEDFLEKLKVLYGPQRLFLIPDMRSFIPEEDTEKFEDFLSSNNLGPNARRQPTRKTAITAPSAPPPPPPPIEERETPTDIDSFSLETDQDTNVLTTNF